MGRDGTSDKSHTMYPPALVLAAGLSSRMGMFKPVLELGGQKLICRVIESLIGSGRLSEVVVVTGHQREKIEAALAGMERVRTVYNADYAAGEMLSSLRAGIMALERCGPPPGFLLAFADQPAVQSHTVGEILERFAAASKTPLVVPTYGGKRGHPIVLAWELVAEIRGLAPSETLRTVVHRHLPQAISIEVPDASILEDLDTLDDFERARRRYGN